MKSFKGFVIRWMANVAELCPWTRHRIRAAIRASAEAAVQTCTGGENDRMCGMRWESGAYDGNTGLGQEMNVLSALMVLLLLEHDDDGQREHGIVTLDTGGTSLEDPHAGESGRFKDKPRVFEPTSRADLIGATILTGLMIVGGMAVFVWISVDAHEKAPDFQRRFREPVGLELQPLPPSAYCRRRQPIEARESQRQRPVTRASEVDLERGHRHASDLDRQTREIHPRQRVIEVIEGQPARRLKDYPLSRNRSLSPGRKAMARQRQSHATTHTFNHSARKRVPG